MNILNNIILSAINSINFYTLLPFIYFFFLIYCRIACSITVVNGSFDLLMKAIYNIC